MRSARSVPRVTLGTAALVLAVPGAVPVARAAADPSEIAACRAIADATERAFCYDQLFGAPGPSAEAAPTGAAAAPAAESASDAAGLARDAAAAQAGDADAEHTNLAIRWELDRGTNRGLWLPRGHERTYILPVRWSNEVNAAPRSPTQPAPVGDGPYDPLEGKFQLSLKLKALDDVLGGPADLWIGYTQQSHWQVYNRDISRPFRETNYAPEVFATVPVKFPFLGLTGRMLNVGVVHQS